MSGASLSHEDRAELAARCRFVQDFDAAQREAFETLVAGILGQTRVLGHRLVITRSMELEVGGWAARIVFKLPNPLYILSEVRGIWLHGSEIVDRKAVGRMLPGNTYSHVRVAWRRGDRVRTLIHELAHCLDYLDRVLDADPGMLMLPSGFRPRWKRFFSRDYLLNGTATSSRSPWHLFKLKRWGKSFEATHQMEAFAVATEWFFLHPKRLWRELPDLYEAMCLVFNQNPANVLFDR